MRRIFVNLETAEREYKKAGGREAMCPSDGWVVFRNSELLSGRLGKVTLGGGNKAGLFQVPGGGRGGAWIGGLDGAGEAALTGHTNPGPSHANVFSQDTKAKVQANPLLHRC